MIPTHKPCFNSHCRQGMVLEIDAFDPTGFGGLPRGPRGRYRCQDCGLLSQPVSERDLLERHIDHHPGSQGILTQPEPGEPNMKPLNEIVAENARTPRPGEGVTIPVDTLDMLVKALYTARASLTDAARFSGTNERAQRNIHNVDLPAIQRAIKAGERAQVAPGTAAAPVAPVAPVAPLKPVWSNLSNIKAGGVEIQATADPDCLVSVDLPFNDEVHIVCLPRGPAGDLADVLEGEDCAFFGVCVYEEADVLRVNGTHDEGGPSGDIEFMFPTINGDNYVLFVVDEEDARALAAFIRGGLEATK